VLRGSSSPRRRPTGRPSTTTCEVWSLPGLSSTGFIAASGATRRAAACTACARPISAPSAVTALLSAHVLRLERRHPHALAGQPAAQPGRDHGLAGVGRRPATSNAPPVTPGLEAACSAGERQRHRAIVGGACLVRCDHFLRSACTSRSVWHLPSQPGRGGRARRETCMIKRTLAVLPAAVAMASAARAAWAAPVADVSEGTADVLSIAATSRSRATRRACRSSTSAPAGRRRLGSVKQLEDPRATAPWTFDTTGPAGSPMPGTTCTARRPVTATRRLA
jgi:hypothetical protein